MLSPGPGPGPKGPESQALGLEGLGPGPVPDLRDLGPIGCLGPQSGKFGPGFVFSKTERLHFHSQSFSCFEAQRFFLPNLYFFNQPLGFSRTKGLAFYDQRFGFLQTKGLVFYKPKA